MGSEVLISTLSIATLRITTLSIMTLNKRKLSIGLNETFSVIGLKVIFCVTTHDKMTLSIMTLSK